jgi:NDP-sugar pyrophosphorylase family protein
MIPVAILAGGLATRLHPLTSRTPKALLPVNGEPFIAHQLRLLRASGVTRAVICAGFLGEMIQDFVGDGTAFGLRVEFSFDGPTLLGTAGAVRKALPLLGEELFVLYGDSYLPCDYGGVEAAFRASEKEALMTVFQNEGRWDASNVEFADGVILAYDKTNWMSRMRHIDYGLGVFRKSAFAAAPDGQAYDLTALHQQLLSRGQLAGFEVRERFYEIGSLAGLQQLSEFLAGRTGASGT